MVAVCTEWFPLGSYKSQKLPGFYMDGFLKQQLDILAQNVINDWDFTIIITAGGEVRVGKSVLAMQIACYWTYLMWKLHRIKVPFNINDNFVFHWQDLIKKGNEMGKKYHYCAMVYDEAGESLEGTKSMTFETKAVNDYLRECGQYNFLNILVLPEFFSLPRSVALTRSKFLLDTYYKADDAGKFERGYFKFFSPRQKKRLYLKGKKELNYFAAPHNFRGRFYNVYTIDEADYRDKKQQAMRSREFRKKDKWKEVSVGMFNILTKEYKLKHKEVGELLNAYGVNIALRTLSDATRAEEKRKEVSKEEYQEMPEEMPQPTILVETDA